MGRLRRLARPPENGMRASLTEKVGEFARKEFTVALPAAKRAASHAARAFFKKFSEEYAKERKKH